MSDQSQGERLRFTLILIALVVLWTAVGFALFYPLD